MYPHLPANNLYKPTQCYPYARIYPLIATSHIQTAYTTRTTPTQDFNSQMDSMQSFYLRRLFRALFSQLPSALAQQTLKRVEASAHWNIPSHRLTSSSPICCYPTRSYFSSHPPSRSFCLSPSPSPYRHHITLIRQVHGCCKPLLSPRLDLCATTAPSSTPLGQVSSHNRFVVLVLEGGDAYAE